MGARARRGQPRKYSDRSDAPAAANGLQTASAHADAILMRSLLEYLGIVTPAQRREPVALPAWARRMLPLLVAALAVVSTLISAFVRALVG
jgi:hypothetical protein